MPWWMYYTFLAILCLSGYTDSTTVHRSVWDPFNKNAEKMHSDIIFDKDPVEPVSSGGWKLHTSDDEDLVESGSGSGSGIGEISPDGPLIKTTAMTTITTTTTTTTTTSRPSTSCESMRQASRQLSGKHVPRCLPNGEFDAIQCQGQPGIDDCWCSDLEGREIPGTVMEAPNVPNCHNGNNMPACVYQLVQHVRSKLLGSFRPRCTSEGLFDHVQCHGSMCFCVDEDTGSRVSGTEVHIPDIPNCDDDSADVNLPESTTETHLPDIKDKNEDIDIDGELETEKIPILIPEENGETIDLDMDVDKNINKKIDKGKGTGEAKPTYHEDNSSKKDKEDEINKSDVESYHGDKMVKASEIMTQPGILAGIIGGSVVLLLCVVLLVMFVVYRMRKKDEGSYPLDEPRKAPNYNYVRAPEKEFYA